MNPQIMKPATKDVNLESFTTSWPVYCSEECDFQNTSSYWCNLLAHITSHISNIKIDDLCKHLTVKEAINAVCKTFMNQIVENTKKTGDANFKTEEEIQEIKNKVLHILYSYFLPNATIDYQSFSNDAIRKMDGIMSFVQNGGWDMIENLRRGNVLERAEKLQGMIACVRMLIDLLNPKTISKSYKGTYIQEITPAVKIELRNILRKHINEFIDASTNLKSKLATQYDEFSELYGTLYHEMIILGMDDKIPQFKFQKNQFNEDILSGQDDILLSQLKILETVLNEEPLPRNKKDKKSYCYKHYYPKFYEIIPWRPEDNITRKCEVIYDLGVAIGINDDTTKDSNQKLKQVEYYIKNMR